MQLGEGHFFGRIPLMGEMARRLDEEADLFAPLGRLLPGLTALNVGFALQPQHLAQVRWGGGGRGEGGLREGGRRGVGGIATCTALIALQGICRVA